MDDPANTHFLVVQLRVTMEYTDIDQHCAVSPTAEPFVLTTLLAGSTPKQAALKKAFSGTNVYSFTDADLAGLEILNDGDLFWLKKIQLLPPLLNEFLRAGKTDIEKYSCSVPAAAALDLKTPVMLDFGVTEVGHLLPTMLRSNTHIIHGKNENKICEVKLSLTQIRRL